MNVPLYPADAFGHETGLVFGVLIGFGFGFVLERSGFGRARVLAAQFYGTDNRVLKVMFSAIVTAVLGIALLGGVGVLDIKQLFVPETFLWPQLVGGLLLGAGFVTSGYCPGTAVVATASGKLDGIFSLAGVMIGSVLFGFFLPTFADFYQSGAMGVQRIPDLLGVPDAVVAAAVVIMAIGAFLGVEILERTLARRRGEDPPPALPHLRNRVLVGFAATTVVVLAVLLLPVAKATVPPKKFATIGSLELARRLVERPRSQHVVDLRPRSTCLKKRIPGALCLPEKDAGARFLADLPDTRELVLYGSGDLPGLPTPARKFPGQALLLRGGFSAFHKTILSPPTVPARPTPETIATFRFRSALHGYFTGARAQRAAPLVPVKSMQRRAKKKAGGC